MSQRWPRQQSGFSDMQLWQQRLMYRQLEELQKLQRLQQLDQEARQQNSSNQFSGVAKQAASDQLPLVVNGMPIHDISNHTWKNDHMGSELKIASSSQMFTVGSMNWEQHRGTLPMQGFPNGLSFSQNQGQVLRSMGLIPQQPDQSLYGIPVSINRSILNQYPQFPGVSNNSVDVVAKSNANQAEKQLMQSGILNSFQSEQCVVPEQVSVQDALATRQISPGKTLFGQVPSQNINNGLMLENVSQLNPLGRSVQFQGFQGRQEQTGWSGSLREKTVSQLGPSQGMSNLDPTEQKLLFGTDGESLWLESSGRIGNTDSGGSLHRNLPEGSDYFNAFPSVQSGSWSALMQSAVAEASSSDCDTGLQDEWSGLTFQQKEPSSGNHPTMSVGSGKQQTGWVENFQSSSTSTSRPFPLSDDADGSTKDYTAAMFCQSYVRSAYDHGQKVDVVVPTSCQLDQNQLHQKAFEGVIQAQMHSGSTPSGSRVGQLYEQPLNTVRAEPKLNQHRLCGTWVNRQSMPLYNGSQSHGKANAWNMSELLPSSRDATLKADDHETTVQHTWTNRPKGASHMQRYQEGNVLKNDEGQISFSCSHPTGGFSTGASGIGSLQMQTSDPYVGDLVGINLNNSKQGMNEKSVSGHQANHGKLVSAGSSLESKGNEDVDKHELRIKKDHVVRGSSMSLFDRASAMAYNKEIENSSQKEVSDGDHISDNSHSAQPNDSGGIRRENSLRAGSDSSQSASGNKRPSHQIGRKNSGPPSFHFHPMGSTGVDSECHNSKQNFYSQGQSQMVICGMKSREAPELVGQSQFGGHSASNSQMAVDKQQLLDSQRGVNASEEIDCRGRISVYDSDIPSLLEGSSANVAQNKSGQTSQNMLQLLRKVDQSRDGSTVSHSGFSSHNMIPETPDKSACDMPSYLQHNQPSALQGIGLAFPFKHQSILDHPLSSQVVNHYKSRHFDLEAGGENDQTFTTSSMSVRTLPLLHEVLERENWDTESNFSGLPNKKTSRSNVQVSSPAISSSKALHARNQLQQQQQQQQWQQQQQQISIDSGCDQSVSMNCGNEPEQDVHGKIPLQIGEFNNLHGGSMHDEAVADQSGQQLLPGISQIPSFKLACSSDGRVPVMSHPHSSDTGQPQVMGTASFLRSSTQLPVLDMQSVSQASMTPVMPQQGAFSAMLQNVWTNVSIQQNLPRNLPANVRPNLFQPVSATSLDMKSWALQGPDDQGRQTASKFATCSINSEQFTYEEQHAGKGNSLRQNASQKANVAPHMSGSPQPQVQESLSQHASDGSSSISVLPMVQLHQQEIGMSKPGHCLSLVKQPSHASLLDIASSSHHVGALGHNFKSSDNQNQNFSLLHQLQAMKAEADPSKLYGKRLRGGDSGDCAQQMVEKMPQNFIYGYNTVSNIPLGNELCATGQQSSFPSDTKMLCFSLESNENQNMVRASQVIGSDFHSQDLTVTGLNSSQNYSSSLSKTSMPSSGVTQPKQIDPQMAHAWFEQYGKFKNGQTLAMYSGLGGPQKTAKAAAQHYFFSKTSESKDVPSAMEQGNDPSQVRSFWHSISTTGTHEQSSSLHYAPVDDIDHNLVPRPKKRKTATSELLPWREEITKGSDKLWNISTAELDWIQATKRLSEKVEDEAKMNGDGLSMPRARRRLILTTRLMQQLLPALPMRFLAADATLEYESVTYLVSRLAIGSACGRISCPDFHFPSISRNMMSEKFNTTEGIGERSFSEVAEDFIGRASKLENDLSRSEKMASTLDIRVECQELERFSMMNRFAKFHGRSHAEGVENSSTSEATPQKMFLQRYVTALSVPGSLPKEMVCLSL